MSDTTWQIDTLRRTIAPLSTGVTRIHYTSPGDTSLLLITAHADNIAGQWPLSYPDDWGYLGASAPGYRGYGWKRGESVGDFSSLLISLTSNPVDLRSTVILRGSPGVEVKLNLVNSIGATLHSDRVSLGLSGRSEVSFLPAWLSTGAYTIQATGNDGSCRTLGLIYTR